VQHTKYLKLDTYILNQLARVIINLGATRNYIYLEFIKKLGLLGKIKAVPELIIGLNRENLETLIIITKLGPVPMVILGHVKQLNFDIILIGWYDIVLGIP
jgi:hypothetical protein